MPSVYGCIKFLNSISPVRQPWDSKIISATSLRPEVEDAREEVYNDMVQRWKTDMPHSLKRFYFIATVCDPRQKSLRFPGRELCSQGQCKNMVFGRVRIPVGTTTP